MIVIINKLVMEPPEGSMNLQHIIIIVVLLFGCTDNPVSTESPFDIEWQAGYTSTYNYSGGVNVGQVYYFKFKVTKGSGDLEMTAEVKKGGDDKESVNHDVVEGELYTFILPVNYWGSSGCTSGSVAGIIEITGGNTDKVLNFKCGSTSAYHNYSIGSPSIQ